jgi:hypothetical protein
MSETLYPHEAVSKYIMKNVFRFDAAFLFILAGMILTIAIYLMSIFHIIMAVAFFIVAWLFNNEDYKCRGLN